MRYTNKFVEFLNGANTIKISGVKDFNSLNSLLKKIGLDFMNCENYWDLLSIAQHNNCAINYSTVLVEYQPYKGMTFGYKSFKESEDWYGQKPWSIKEILDSIKN